MPTIDDIGRYAIFPWITWNNKARAEQALFNGVTFASFEEGWDWIYATDPNENDETGYYDDYYVEQLTAADFEWRPF